MANWALLQEQLTDKQVVKRAKHGIHFDNGDGQILANFSGKPCHWQDTDGLWKPLDTRLLLAADGFYGCPHSPVKVHTDGRVKVDGSDYAQFTKLPGSPIGRVDGDRIVREFPGGYQELFVTEDGFREVITVNKPTFPLEKFIGKASGTLPSAYKAHAQTAVDANGDVFGITADIKAFGDWLDAAVYPVVIDPDFLAGTTNHVVYSWSTSSYATANSTSAAEGTSGTLACGQSNVDAFQCSRIFLLFDTSSIGAGSTVTQVNLKLTVINDFSSTDFTPIIKTFNWDGLTREQKFDGILTADSDDSDFGSTGTGSWANNTLKTSGNLSTAWVNKTGTTFYGIVSDRDIAAIQPSNNELINFGSASYSVETRRAYLSVTYTEAASGSLLHVNMNAQMQNLSGNMRG